MLINLSNHPSSNWPANQLDAATCFGKVLDIPFPSIDPNGDETYIQCLSDEYVDRIMQYTPLPVVHIMGELSFVYATVNKLMRLGVKCIVSTTERIVIDENGTKLSEFRFTRFREYTISE